MKALVGDAFTLREWVLPKALAECGMQARAITQSALAGRRRLSTWRCSPTGSCTDRRESSSERGTGPMKASCDA